MNKLLLPAIMIGGLLQTAGCIISSDTSGDAAFFDVSWSAAECPAGTAARVNSQNAANSELFTDIYDCSAGGGITAPLPLGNYDVWVEITSADNSQLLAQSNSVASTLSLDGAVTNVAIPSFPVNAGYFGLTWSLVDGGGDLTCEEVFANGVEIVATLASTSELLVDIFNCTDYSAISDEYPIGLYTIDVDILQDETVLGSSQTREETITFGNEVVDLGNFEFTF